MFLINWSNMCDLLTCIKYKSGLSGSALPQLKSDFHTYMVSQKESEPWRIITGVPQGSVLGRLIFSPNVQSKPMCRLTSAAHPESNSLQISRLSNSTSLLCCLPPTTFHCHYQVLLSQFSIVELSIEMRTAETLHIFYKRLRTHLFRVHLVTQKNSL